MTLETQLNSVLDCHAPYKEVKMRSTFRRGLSDETKNPMKERNSLQRRMKKLAGDQQLQMHLKYRQLRNKCVNLQRRDTVQDNVNQFNQFNGLTNPQDNKVYHSTQDTD
jgi:mRNA-degrading endonuclease YafQ of YafQ-DinJ toxin-antitoxin module